MLDLRNSDVTPRVKKQPFPLADIDPYQRLIVESALAYYFRGQAIQYDSVELTQQSRWAGGIIRSTTQWPPEKPNVNDPMFSVCSAFCYDVISHAFSGYKLLGSPHKFVTLPICELPEDHPLVAFKVDFGRPLKKDEPIDESRLPDLKRLEEALQPGDILVACGKTAGHAVMYVGDAFGTGTRYIVHCWGNKYNMETGEEQWEFNRKFNWEGGAIRRDDIKVCLYDESATWKLWKQKTITIIRPLNILPTEEYPVNPECAYRLRFPWIAVNRRADHDNLRSVEPGGKITVTLSVTNNASAYSEPITVTEKIPAHCRLKKNSITGGGKLTDENTITWELHLGLGEEITMQYTVIASDEIGETIRLTGGKVGELTTNEIDVRIGGRPLKEESIEALADIQAGDKLADGKLPGAAFAEKFYEKYFGVCPKLPTLEQLVETLFEPKEYPECPIPLLTPVEGFYEKAPMLVPKFFGGTDVQTQTASDRTLTVHERQMYPGDVFLAKENLYHLDVPDCFVYLGNDRFAYCGEDGSIQIKTHAESAQRLFSMGVFFGLRPTLGYRDIYCSYEL